MKSLNQKELTMTHKKLYFFISVLE